YDGQQTWARARRLLKKTGEAQRAEGSLCAPAPSEKADAETCARAIIRPMGALRWRADRLSQPSGVGSCFLGVLPPSRTQPERAQ
ncbi:hypothetical protein LPJ57_007150, partial [Coemansia sp. RSA 486]